MLSCPTHGRRLETEQAFWRAEALRQPAPDRAAPEHILVMDRLTFQGLTSGTVSLPCRPVHVGVWLRLLRTLLDEASLSTSQVRRHSAAALVAPKSGPILPEGRLACPIVRPPQVDAQEG
ncbi:hypothetical protein [Nonomuraea zeae]|uniref:Uncharacterized protein n=2 Tax=Nonomuraea zeae TaxID=1642303 RepID=A0A5S4GFI9_9ACTN|nr:hypothetical protein [Nonomuraea zeae]TMR31737.1 hypothetical protein ETD85_24920 [Nonomuraea zeae]